MRTGHVVTRRGRSFSGALLPAIGLFVASGPTVFCAPAWPQFRGPGRDGQAPVGDKRLMRRWPEGGPPVVWRVAGIGRGWSSPIIVGDRIYITGDIGEDLWVHALDLRGRRLWKVRNGRAWKGPYPGARASCTYAGGRLFHLNAHGRAVCLDPATGRELWSLNILERFDGREIRWGLSECLLVDGERVIVTPGGRKALMAALHVRDGAVVWTSPPLTFLRTEALGGRKVDPPRPDIDSAGYASPILVGTGEGRWIAGASGRHVFLVDARTGRLVWKQYVPVRWEVIGAMPLRVGRNRVVFAAPDVGVWCVQIRTDAGDIRVDEVWRADPDNCHGGFVFFGDRLYGAGYRRARGWFCLDAATGRVCYETRRFRKGAIIAAGKQLYALAENGVVALLSAGADRFEVCGWFRLPEGRGADVWAHPVLLDGRLYVRRHDILWCYDVSERAASMGTD